MKNQDIFSLRRTFRTFVPFNYIRKPPDVQGFFLCCGHRFRYVAIIIPFSAVSPIQYTEGSHWAVEVALGGLFAAQKTERRFSLWHSKSRRSNEQKSTPLYAKLAVIAIRETVCCWRTAKKQNACSSFLGTVSTATFFWKRYYRLKKNCTQKSYGKTGLLDNCPKKRYLKYF